MIEVEARVEVRPTEDLSKVRKALENLVTPSNLRVESRGGYRLIVASGRGGGCLKKLYYALRRQRILDSARGHLKRGIVGDTIIFYLHKQAAYMGVVSFCSFPEGESPLGSITIVIRSKDPLKVLNWLTPRTVNGVPVEEGEEPDP